MSWCDGDRRKSKNRPATQIAKLKQEAFLSVDCLATWRAVKSLFRPHPDDERVEPAFKSKWLDSVNFTNATIGF